MLRQIIRPRFADKLDLSEVTKGYGLFLGEALARLSAPDCNQPPRRN